MCFTRLVLTSLKIAFCSKIDSQQTSRCFHLGADAQTSVDDEQTLDICGPFWLSCKAFFFECAFAVIEVMCSTKAPISPLSPKLFPPSFCLDQQQTLNLLSDHLLHLVVGVHFSIPSCALKSDLYFIFFSITNFSFSKQQTKLYYSWI